MSLVEFFFPYRTHLEREVEYLKTQLEAANQRANEASRRFFELKSPDASPVAPVVMHERRPRIDGPAIGWDQYRAKARREREQEEANG